MLLALGGFVTFFRAHKMLYGGAVSIAAVGAALATLTLAQAAPAPKPVPDTVGARADAPMPAAIEDFAYPNAAQILQEKNIVLKRGDGHITLADCASGTDLLVVDARDKKDKTCFKVVGKSGWLTLEMPAVFLVKGNDYKTTVDMTVGNEEKSFDVAKNAWTSVGEPLDPESRDHTLVEIRTSK